MKPWLVHESLMKLAREAGLMSLYRMKLARPALHERLTSARRAGSTSQVLKLASSCKRGITYTCCKCNNIFMHNTFRHNRCDRIMWLSFRVMESTSVSHEYPSKIKFRWRSYVGFGLAVVRPLQASASSSFTLLNVVVTWAISALSAWPGTLRMCSFVRRIAL